MKNKPSLDRTRMALLAVLVFILFISVPVMISPGGCNHTAEIEGTVSFDSDEPVTIYVEIAETRHELSQGLMNRETLAPDEGMIFIFPDDGPRTFWMKNTLIPLDMIFVNSSMDIVNIIRNVQPCETLSCPTYGSGRPAMYVVETVAGFSDQFGLEPGQKISFSRTGTLC